MNRSIVLAARLLLLAGLCVSASAEPKVDNYWVQMSTWVNFKGGGGSGFDAGQWYPYTFDEVPLRAQWFYDDPPLPSPQYKEITLSFDITSTGGTVGYLDWVAVGINWTTLGYPPVGPGGPIPSQSDVDAGLVDFTIFFSGLVDEGAPVHLEGQWTIPDFNPEWVSVDVTVLTPGLVGIPVVQSDPNAVYSVVGTITHECIPEPSTIALSASGLLALVIFRRRIK
jgi:hypothetical protein